MRRSLLLAAMVVVAMASLAYLVSVRLWHESDDDVPPATSEPAVARGVTIVSADGRVERLAESGSWSSVGTGDRVSLAERLRTDVGSQAEIDIGDGSTLVLAARSEVEVRGQNERETRLRLQHGRLFADKKKRGSSILRIEVPESDTTVAAAEGSFTVTTDGLGTLAVATTAGNVTVQTDDQKTLVPAGQQAVAYVGEPTLAATPIPSALLLKVGTLPAGIRRERSLVVDGESEPGAHVAVNGVRARVDRTGRFRAEIALREGSNSVSVVAQGVSGVSNEITLDPVVVDSQAPTTTVQSTWE